MLVEEELLKRRYVLLLAPSSNPRAYIYCCRKVQVQFANEGAEKKKQEEEVSARKRKIEEKEKWEGESEFPSCHPVSRLYSRVVSHLSFSSRSLPLDDNTAILCPYHLPLSCEKSQISKFLCSPYISTYTPSPLSPLFIKNPSELIMLTLCRAP